LIIITLFAIFGKQNAVKNRKIKDFFKIFLFLGTFNVKRLEIIAFSW